MSKLAAQVAVIQSLTPTAVEVVLARENQDCFWNFQPGQYATVSFPAHPHLHGERSFSIASAPTDRATLRFGIRLGGRYTQALQTLQPGDPAVVNGPFGRFTFDEERDRSAVFIAGGIGVTPFLSMIRSASDRGLANELTLIYSVRSLADAPFLDELLQLERLNPRFRLVCAVSDGQITRQTNARFFPGRITAEILDAAVAGQSWARSYFLCGPPAFMNAMLGALKSRGIRRAAVKSERFSVGSSAIIEPGTMIPAYVFAAWSAVAVLVFGIIIKLEQANRASIQKAAATMIESVSNPPAVNATPAEPGPVNSILSQAPTVPSPGQVSPSRTTVNSVPTPVQPTPRPAPAPVTAAPKPAPVKAAPKPVASPTPTKPKPVNTTPVTPRTQLS